jgi:hypothetical protein
VYENSCHQISRFTSRGVGSIEASAASSEPRSVSDRYDIGRQVGAATEMCELAVRLCSAGGVGE